MPHGTGAEKLANKFTRVAVLAESEFNVTRAGATGGLSAIVNGAIDVRL